MQRATKQRLVAIARTAGLLPLLDAGRFVQSKWQSARANRQFRDANPEFTPPPLWWMHDMYRHTSFAQYWATGQATAQSLAVIIGKYVEMPEPRVADWGCGLGRVVRHLPDVFQRYGFDYNEDAVKWCTEHISGIEFGKNELMPPLAVEDSAFDALYALSVFTHLSAPAHKQWIGEIGRVLAPGGIFIGAFHMRPLAGQLLPGEQARFDAGELVVRGGVKEGSRTFTAHHPEGYLRSKLFAGFEILEKPSDLFGQTLFIVRKK